MYTSFGARYSNMKPVLLEFYGLGDRLLGCRVEGQRLERTVSGLGFRACKLLGVFCHTVSS